MEILKIDRKNPEPAIIRRAAQVIRAGGIIIYPTDTCYGIGGDATNDRVRKKVAEMKGRAAHKLFPVIVRDRDMLHSIALDDEDTQAILVHYLPGPFTFILMTRNLQKWPYNSIGIRLPRQAITNALAGELTVPILSTSANLSGEPAAYAIADLEETLLNPEVCTVIPDLIIDAGVLPPNPPSTIVDVTVSPPRIARQGAAEFIWPLRP